MSFRSRLLLFFAIIVVIPMTAVALVLFSLAGESETGKADARIATGLRVTLGLYGEAQRGAGEELAVITRDRVLRRALVRGRTTQLAKRSRQLAQRDPVIASIAFTSPGGARRLLTGSKDTIAPAVTASRSSGGRRLGVLALSVTEAQPLARQVKRLTGLEVRLFRGERLVASTLREARAVAGRASGAQDDVKVRGRFQEVRDLSGSTLRMGVFQRSSELEGAVAKTRRLLAGVLLAFFLLALLSSVMVVRALQGQIAQFLDAARALGAGDFGRRVPTEGRDEFAALGSEFNNMSEQLARNLEEVERKRRELEETIRRVGEAFAAGLDRAGLVELAVRTAVDACSAQGGRARPREPLLMPGATVGSLDDDLTAALEAAEAQTVSSGGDDAVKRPSPRDPEAPVERRPVRVSLGRTHAMALGMGARGGDGVPSGGLGVISIARSGNAFTDSELDLFAYLVGQVAISLENASLHETIQRQAVTDELTGLFNVRHFQETLETEIERGRRFTTEVGLVMLDLDNFKSVNDTHGHQQGDLVLREVAKVLRDYSRDIDEPARYGGEEMAVVLPQTDIEGAALLAERMRAAVESLVVERLDGKGALPITASFGVASLPEAAADRESLIAAADAALYAAKRAGKNRVERARPAPASASGIL